MKINDIIRIKYRSGNEWKNINPKGYEIIAKITGHAYGNATYVKIVKVVSNAGEYDDIKINNTQTYGKILFDERFYKIEKLNENEFPEYFIWKDRKCKPIKL